MTTDLDRLIEAVEARTAEPKLFYAALTIRAILAEIAYYGSLDEAVALLEALLPGWTWSRSFDGTMTVWTHGVLNSKWGEQSDPNPARALLLATLRAYRSTREGG